MLDVSIGAIGAAAIAAIVSLLGLIISKEQKTSEFRQAWVDALRTEITTYLTNLNAIADAVRVPYPTQAEKVKALSPHYSSLNEANFSIVLRLNEAEKLSRDVIGCMDKFSRLALDYEQLVPKNIRPIEKEFLEAARKLLKSEWRRVKRGEMTFIVAKMVSLGFAIAAIIWAGLLASNQFPSSGAAGTSPPREVPA
jgi:hypothetical protein